MSNSLELLGDGSDLLDAVLVGSQIALEGLVLLLEGLEVVELALAEVSALQHLLLAFGPVLVDVGLVLELLGEVLKTLQPEEHSKVLVPAAHRGSTGLHGTYLIISDSSQSSKAFSFTSRPFQALAMS